MPLHDPTFPQDHTRLLNEVRRHLSAYGIHTQKEVTVDGGRADLVATNLNRPLLIEVKIDYWDKASLSAKRQLSRYAADYTDPLLAAIRLTRDGISLEIFEVKQK